MNYHDQYHSWLQYLSSNQPDAASQLAMMDGSEIKEAFGDPLSFGTAGLRGKVGWGPGRLNSFSICRASRGFARYILTCDAPRRVGIAYDTRESSAGFARMAAASFLEQGLEVYLFPKTTPTPLLSYAVRQLGLGWGVVITASHNPGNHNGYKCYDRRGVQLLPEESSAVSALIAGEPQLPELPHLQIENHPAFHWISEELESQYLMDMLAGLPNHGLGHRHGQELPIVFTPLYGSGANLIEQALQKQGFFRSYFLQMQPHPTFGNLVSPNPEEESVYWEALELAGKVGARLIMATDADADRLGVMTPVEGNWQLLSGNQIAALMVDYLLENSPEAKDSALITSIVSGRLAQDIAHQRGLPVLQTLTGFKFIGDLAEKRSFFFGYEESCGYLFGNLSRDKDAVQAAALTAEMALYWLRKGKTLYQRWQELSSQYGWYGESTVNLDLSREKATFAMDRLAKENNFSGELRLASVEDYRQGFNPGDHGHNCHRPQAQMLALNFEGGHSCLIRPSGTEDKVKCYFSGSGTSEEEANRWMERVKEAVLVIIGENFPPGT
ncbi:MAG: phospho-sugar mutase [Clostridiales bacterium]|nr:phospho-sugar mutase [Clostridiales bacterium]